MRQDAPEIPDMLSSFFSKESEKDGVFVDGNIALISRSGVYYVGDGENKIGFGHVHVRDTLKKEMDVVESMYFQYFLCQIHL